MCAQCVCLIRTCSYTRVKYILQVCNQFVKAHQIQSFEKPYIFLFHSLLKIPALLDRTQKDRYIVHFNNVQKLIRLVGPSDNLLRI